MLTEDKKRFMKSHWLLKQVTGQLQCCQLSEKILKEEQIEREDGDNDFGHAESEVTVGLSEIAVQQELSSNTKAQGKGLGVTLK